MNLYRQYEDYICSFCLKKFNTDKVNDDQTCGFFIQYSLTKRYYIRVFGLAMLRVYHLRARRNH